jgi:hypothetical protein
MSALDKHYLKLTDIDLLLARVRSQSSVVLVEDDNASRLSFLFPHSRLGASPRKCITENEVPALEVDGGVHSFLPR